MPKSGIMRQQLVRRNVSGGFRDNCDDVPSLFNDLVPTIEISEIWVLKWTWKIVVGVESLAATLTTLPSVKRRAALQKKTNSDFAMSTSDDDNVEACREK